MHAPISMNADNAAVYCDPKRATAACSARTARFRAHQFRLNGNVVDRRYRPGGSGILLIPCSFRPDVADEPRGCRKAQSNRFAAESGTQVCSFDQSAVGAGGGAVRPLLARRRKERPTSTPARRRGLLAADSQEHWAQGSAADFSASQMPRISAMIIITRPAQLTTQIAERTPNKSQSSPLVCERKKRFCGI